MARPTAVHTASAHQAEEGYTRLFINLGKRDNFYAREIINLVNRHVRGAKVEIGRIDLTNNCSFFEVPDADAPLVLSKMKRVKVGDRKVVVDHAERTDGQSAPHAGERNARPERKQRGQRRTYAEVADARSMKQQWKADKKADKKAKRKSNSQPEYAPAKKKITKDDWKQFFE